MKNVVLFESNPHPPPHLHMQNPPYLFHSTSSLSVASNQPIQAEKGGGTGPSETTAKEVLAIFQ
jgi:hypothetical protein